MHIYVDGSFNPATNVWGGGAVLCDDTEEKVIKTLTISADDVNGSRQINGELESTIIALEYLMTHPDIVAEDKEVILFHDYEGIGKWATNVWTARKPVAKSYKTRVNRILLELRFAHKIDVKFEKVKAHSGDKMNDLADRLCGEACGVK